MKILLYLLISTSVYSQTEQEAAEKAYLANINSLLVFTSESGLSSGQYRFTNANYKIQTYALPFTHHFQPHTEKLNFFVNGSLGYSITRLDTRITTLRSGSQLDLDYDNKLKTYIAGLGGGIRYRSDLGIDLSGSLGLIYSRVGISISPKDEISDAVKDFFNSQYNDNITYKLLFSAEYIKKLNGFKSHTKADFKAYETKASFSLDALTGFTTQSDVTSVYFGLETPSLMKYKEDFLSMEGYIKMNYLHGDITDVVKFNKYMNIGALAYWNTPNFPFWASRFYTEVSTVRAEGLEGYNVGIGFSLDY